MKEIIRKIASWFNLDVRSAYAKHQQEKYTYILEQIIEQQGKNDSLEEGVSVVVFSKDRACQLHALLNSYFHFVKHPGAITVLYACSSKDFLTGYEKLKKETFPVEINWVKESNFKLDLNTVLSEVSSKKVLFLVDDIVFKNALDWNALNAINTSKYIFSLRHGKHLSYSYTTREKQPLPQFVESVDFPNFCSWSWSASKLDWAYAASVDGHLFSTVELKVIAQELEYKAPNTFEHALQTMQPLFARRNGLCCPESIIVNVPCNKVQTENDNHAGDLSSQAINELWLKGNEIDFLEMEGIKNESAHQELTFKFVTKAE